jgi:hypothetical protein
MINTKDETQLIKLALDKAGYILKDGLTVFGNLPNEKDLIQCFLDYADCVQNEYTLEEVQEMIDSGELTVREMAIRLIK